MHYREMSPAELRYTVGVLARICAVGSYRRSHPAASEAEAWQWAERNHSQFKDDGIEMLVVFSAYTEMARTSLARVN